MGDEAQVADLRKNVNRNLNLRRALRMSSPLMFAITISTQPARCFGTNFATQHGAGGGVGGRGMLLEIYAIAVIDEGIEIKTPCPRDCFNLKRSY
jgi:hypothetical protein